MQGSFSKIDGSDDLSSLEKQELQGKTWRSCTQVQNTHSAISYQS